uniref:Uncharacterized protein n=1 Tax=Anguilla anguilla TaxID=7936 RepID=A0A0E9XKJ4_ANGAN
MDVRWVFFSFSICISKSKIIAGNTAVLLFFFKGRQILHNTTFTHLIFILFFFCIPHFCFFLFFRRAISILFDM